jgi:hypothetical protein
MHVHVERELVHRDAANRGTPIRSIPDRFRFPKVGIRHFTEKNFSSRKATQGLTSQASKLRGRNEIASARRRDFVFGRMQVILILSEQVRCRVLRA